MFLGVAKPGHALHDIVAIPGHCRDDDPLPAGLRCHCPDPEASVPGSRARAVAPDTRGQWVMLLPSAGLETWPQSHRRPST